MGEFHDTFLLGKPRLKTVTELFCDTNLAIRMTTFGHFEGTANPWYHRKWPPKRKNLPSCTGRYPQQGTARVPFKPLEAKIASVLCATHASRIQLAQMDQRPNIRGGVSLNEEAAKMILSSVSTLKKKPRKGYQLRKYTSV